MDLAIKSKGTEVAPASPSEPKIRYPGFSLNDEAAEAFTKEYDCDLGDVLTATVKLKVNGKRADEYGKSISFDMLTLDNVTEAKDGADEASKGESDDSEGDSEEKMLGYKRPTVSKETPELSAEDLSE